MLRPLQLGLAALALAAATIGSGCSDSSGPVAPLRQLQRLPPRAPVTAPIANSPTGLLRLVEWCWNHLDVASYRTVFTDDYRFVFGALDPAGNAYRSTPWTRQDEIQALAGLAASEPLEVAVTFDRNFRITDDPRPGHLPTWHSLIRTSVTVHLVTADQRVFTATGYANFFVVRGDSAVIPPDLMEEGVRPDSTRWYVQRWEDDTFSDETFSEDGLHAMPAVETTWGSIKVEFR